MKQLIENNATPFHSPTGVCRGESAAGVKMVVWREREAWEDFKALTQSRNVFSCYPLANDLFPSCPLQLFPFLWISGLYSLSMVFVKGTARSLVCEKVHVVCFIHIQELSWDKQFRRQNSENWNVRGVFVYGSVLDLAAVSSGSNLSARWAAVAVTHKHSWICEGRVSSQQPAAFLYLLFLVICSELWS